MSLMVLSKSALPRVVAASRPVGRPAGPEALRMELTAAGMDMRAAGLAIVALLANDNDLDIEQEAARLVVRGEAYIARGKAA